jgi:hypothetical protein
LEAKKLELALDGRVSVAGLGTDMASLEAEGGDGDWQGRLVVRWSPDTPVPELHGDGSLDVENLHVTVNRSSETPVRALIDDVSWHGDFAWRGEFTTEGAVLGTRVEVSDASQTASSWHARAEDFSWRLHAQSESDPQALGVRVQDFDLARVSVSVTNAAAPLDIAAEKLAVDELRSTQSGDVVLGQATADTLTITGVGGAGKGGSISIDVSSLMANGLSGDAAGTLHVAKVRAEALEISDAVRHLRAEEIDFASVGIRVPAWVGAAELSIKSARFDEGRGDIWLSDLQARKLHGDTDGRFGAEGVDVTHAFQSGTAEVSWQASGLKVRGIDGDAHDSASISAVDLRELKVGVDDESWESTGLRTSRLAVTMTGDVDVARLGFDTLERRQPGTGDVRISELDARGFRSHGASRATLDGVTAVSLAVRLPDGADFTTRALEARALTGDSAKGFQAGRFSVAGGEGRDLHGARLSAATLEASGLSATSGNGIAVDKASLERFSRSAPDAATLDVEHLDVLSLILAPGGGLSVARAAIRAARFADSGELAWALSKFDADDFDWDGVSRLSAGEMTLASLTQTHGDTRDWLARMLRATALRLTLPGDVAVATMSAGSIDGGAGSPAWSAASVDIEGFSSSETAGQKADRLTAGAVEVTDHRNGALLTLDSTYADAVEVSVLKELAARHVTVGGLRLASDDPNWPSRLSMAELRVDAPLLHSGGILDLGEVMARNPYLIVAQSADNVWMWPPLPGGGSDAADNSDASSTGGIRVGRFTTRGPGRAVYIDRATEPVVQLALDPVVVAVENLDTSLPGNRSRFRVRGNSSRFAGLALEGDFVKGVHGFDLVIEAHATGLYLPEFNPYVARHEPMMVTSGWGDVHSAITIDNHQLTGRVDVLLSGLRLRRTAGGTKLPPITPLNLTLSAALAVLRDREGNISLNVPLRAQTEDPNYDFIDSFQRDFVRAVQGAGRVAASVSGRALDGTVRLIESTVSVLPGVDTTRYPPIEFPPGADDVTARHLEYMNQLGDRMLRYESLEIALCGRSVSADSERITEKTSTIDKLFAEAGKGVYPSYTPGREGMLALAGVRAETVRRYLRDLRGVPNERLAPCDAQFDAAPGARPRVELEVKSPARRRGLFGLFP